MSRRIDFQRLPLATVALRFGRALSNH